jgi:DtxR family Mn-dependent transcriptional regulator
MATFEAGPDRSISISLTSQGRGIAQRKMIRHHLIERILLEMFGMSRYEIHYEAERLEHAVSPAFEKKLVERLGHKDTCPHGNGLALRSPAECRKRGMRLLSEAEAGSKYVVASVYERDRKVLEFFEKRGSVRAFALRSRPETTILALRDALRNRSPSQVGRGQ